MTRQGFQQNAYIINYEKGMEEFGGKTVVTVWCDSEKSIETFRAIGTSVAEYYSVERDDLLFVNRKGEMTIKYVVPSSLDSTSGMSDIVLAKIHS